MKFLVVFGIAVPMFAQFGGPAILSRGDAPSAMVGPQIDFRPFVEVSGVYNTGLSGVRVDSQGNIANQSSYGANITAGVSGYHSWRHTAVGLTLRAGYSYFVSNSAYDSTDVSANLGVRRQLSRHVSFTWNNTFGMFNRDAGLLASISPSVPFDPNQTYLPATDFFNNRTVFASSQMGLVIQHSTRLSFSLGGGLFDNYRQSLGLYGVVGENGGADVQYRISKRATIGAAYGYSHYAFQRITSNTNLHSAMATFAYQLSRWWEFTGSAGAARVESKFIQSVPVDPAVAAIIGISESSQVVYTKRYVPDLAGRISRTFHKGVFYASAAYGITPGNGLFLTSEMMTVGVGYTYTGLRQWSFGAAAGYHAAKSIGNVYGTYGDDSVNAHVARRFFRSIHGVATFTVNRYASGDFSKYNQLVYAATIGLGWTPGDIPLRIW